MGRKRIEKTDVDDVLKKMVVLARNYNTSYWIVLKEVCRQAGVEYPEKLRYFTCKSMRAEGVIEPGDIITFDRLDVELKNNSIYSFIYEFGKYSIEDWGRYDEETDKIITDFSSYSPDDVVVFGKLVRVKSFLLCT